MKKTKRERKYMPTIADLIDSLTINQIKEIKFPDQKEAYREEIGKICHDIDLVLDEKNIVIDSRFIRILIVLAQLNLSIWENKDQMQKESPENYLKLLKLSHQLNGVRNTLKNKISEIIGDSDPVKKRTNIETDDLKGWTVDVD